MLKLNKYMNTKNIKEFGEVWKVLNEKYDGYIEEIINTPEAVSISPKRLEELKNLQKELFEMEVKLLDSRRGK